MHHFRFMHIHFLSQLIQNGCLKIDTRCCGSCFSCHGPYTYLRKPRTQSSYVPKNFIIIITSILYEHFNFLLLLCVFQRPPAPYNPKPFAFTIIIPCGFWNFCNDGKLSEANKFHERNASSTLDSWNIWTGNFGIDHWYKWLSCIRLSQYTMHAVLVVYIYIF